MLLRFLTLALLVMSVQASPAVAQKGIYLSIPEFRELAFPRQAVDWQTLWVNSEQREQMESIVQRRFSALRIRYLGQGQKTAWIFEEIGKELPITIGVVVEAGRIAETVVLEYRESRGGEIRHPFFTRQFRGLTLESKGDLPLNGRIDGITGATLSVNAMKKIARLALYCHDLTPFALSDAETELSTAS